MSKLDFFRQILAERILVLDGAMGTQIQQKGLTEEHFKGQRFANHPVNLQGNNDVLSVTYPQVIEDIHTQYLQAGAHIVETNSFNANAISQDEYGLAEFTYEINRAAAQAARRAVDAFVGANPTQQRFVAGSIGPTGRLASLSDDVANPRSRGVTFQQLADAYYTQAKGLVDCGADLLLVETVFDTLNAKAALFAISQLSDELGETIPTVVSGTISDSSGRLLSGQTIEAFVHSLNHFPLLAIGLNCALGAEQLEPFIKRLAAVANVPISVHPNAGLPDSCGCYHESPQQMASTISRYLKSGRVAIVGGCCGTTPAHIAAIADVASRFKPGAGSNANGHFTLAGLEPLQSAKGFGFVAVGEKTNVAGSLRFAKLVAQGDWDTAVSIARAQVDAGAEVLDVCMDDALLNAPEAMENFLRHLSSDPDVARVPIMVDSSDFTVIETGLRCLQGRSVVNSISLRDGDAAFVERAKLIKRYGAAVIVMLADEEGQAVTTERRVSIAQRSYQLLTNGAGYLPHEIIFDPNVLTVGTGMAEHASYALSFIESCRIISQKCPGAIISGGVSNLSFAFRGNNHLREALHAVFLHHAKEAGLSMAIINPETLPSITDIDITLRELCEDLILNRRSDATERLIAHSKQLGTKVEAQVKHNQWEDLAPRQRLEYAIEHGEVAHLTSDVSKVLLEQGSAIGVVEGPMMSAMKRVGQRFNAGELFLSQVVKSARAMKVAVNVLEPYFDDSTSAAGYSAGTVVLATVKGDVHDIGKNIVSVVLSCNGFRVVDLGVMVPAEDIVAAVKREGASIVGVSGLISPSLAQMEHVAQELNAAGISIPLLIGGAATSEQYVAQRLKPIYNGRVVYTSDASQAAIAALELARSVSSSQPLHHQEEKKETGVTAQSDSGFISYVEAQRNPFRVDWASYKPAKPKVSELCTFANYPLTDLERYINWTEFFHTWGIPGRFPAIFSHPQKGDEAKSIYSDAKMMLLQIDEQKQICANGVVQVFPACSQGDDIILFDSPERTRVLAVLPQLRNQQRKGEGAANASLADFVAPLSHGVTDYVALFAVTAGIGADALAESLGAKGDEYHKLMLKVLTDRLAEAFAEQLHHKVRTDIWGYAANEQLTVDDMLRGRYVGIRPAPGYPICPDHRLRRTIFQLLDATQQTGITLTESLAMNPASSVAGFMLANPKAQYFGVGPVQPDQLESYAARWNTSVTEVLTLLNNQ